VGINVSERLCSISSRLLLLKDSDALSVTMATQKQEVMMNEATMFEERNNNKRFCCEMPQQLRFEFEGTVILHVNVVFGQRTKTYFLEDS
jgi:hypothetical protein